MGIAKSWRIFTSHVQPRRLFQEDAGVKGPLWFGRRPDSALHVLANLLRLFFAFFFTPFYVLVPHTRRSESNIIRRILWGIEWAKTPDAVLLEAPGSLLPERGQLNSPSRGQYAVTGYKPKWLLEVEFRGSEIVSQTQVKYEWEREKTKDGGTPKKAWVPSDAKALRRRIEKLGYTAISYAMESAEELFVKSMDKLYPQPEISPGGKRKYSLPNRRKISQKVLDEYARARTTLEGKGDGVEFIWLDEFCLSDRRITDETETTLQRDVEVGQLADIFRGAKRTVVFCHIEDCDHTDVICPWGNRLFTLGEILYTPEVLRMTRSKETEYDETLTSYLTILSGQEFRGEMQTCAAEAKMWHLYNIMQHATNSGSVTWQSAIHSLVVEAIRRDEADNYHAHDLLGKALNGLLPRRSQLEDLQGANGWADLAWLLELNQGYYNAALLSAVCKIADPGVEEYRWWGKPITPKEGSERLEALVTAIPVCLRKGFDKPAQPALSIIGPKSIALEHWLLRDSAGLYRNPEMKSLKRWALWSYFFSVIIGFLCMWGSILAGIALIWLASEAYVILELLVGTMFVEKDTWVVMEDHITGGYDPYRWLQSQDPTFDDASEWGPRQLIPQWDRAQLCPSPPGSLPHPYAATLIDLQTGVLTRVAVTSRPNNMVILAVHGSGITCMLLDRDDKKVASTVAVKVGMANLPPFILAQAEESGTIYVGGGIFREPSPPRGVLHKPPTSNTYTHTHTPASTGSHDIEKHGGSSSSPNRTMSQYTTSTRDMKHTHY